MNIGETIKLKEWVRLDSIEGLLNAFQQRLISQELKIATLQSLCERLVSTELYKEQHSVSEMLPL